MKRPSRGAILLTIASILLVVMLVSNAVILHGITEMRHQHDRFLESLGEVRGIAQAAARYNDGRNAAVDEALEEVFRQLEELRRSRHEHD